MKNEDADSLAQNSEHDEESEGLDLENKLPNGNVTSDSVEEAGGTVNELVSVNESSESPGEGVSDLRTDEMNQSLPSEMSIEPAPSDILGNDDCIGLTAAGNEDKGQTNPEETEKNSNVILENRTEGLGLTGTEVNETLIESSDTTNEILNFDFESDANDKNKSPMEQIEQDENDSGMKDDDVDFENFGQVTVEDSKFESIGFDAAPLVTDNEESGRAAAPSTPDNAFEEFGVSTSMQPERNEPTSIAVTAPNDLGEFSSSDFPPTTASADEREEDKSKDSVGIDVVDNHSTGLIDFGAGADPNVEQTQESKCPAIKSNDPYEDFDATVANPEKNAPIQQSVPVDVEDNAASEEKLNTDDRNSEDFCDFHENAVAAQKEEIRLASGETDEIGNSSVPNIPKVQINDPTEDVSDSDFGDFSSDHHVSTTAVGKEVAAKQTFPAPNVDNDPDDVDGFGNFDGADVSQKEENEPTSAINKDDDDSGDFGTAGAPEVSQKEENGPASAINDDNDDEFGDFGTAEAAVMDDDDDFGDFDTAISEKAPKINQAEEAENDEFGEFGDFNTSTESKPLSNHEHVEDDDFGDFGDFSEPSEPTKAIEKETLHIDPLVPKAMAVFADVFTTDELRDKRDPIEGTESDKPVTLAVIMSEVCPGENALQENEERLSNKSSAADLVVESLDRMLLPENVPIIQEASVKVIFGKNTIHPYSQYTCLPSEEDISKRSYDARESENQKVNMMISFDSVESSSYVGADVNGEENIANNEEDAVMSPEDSLPKDVKLDFSEFEAPSENGDSGIGDNGIKVNGTGIRKGDTTCTASFLKKIPDLSFMLNSTLMMPKR